MADSELSYEMIMEVMSRGSLKTLDMMRCTNKELNKLTYESYLLDLYINRNKIVSGFIIPSTQGIGSMHDINEFAPSLGSTSLDLSFLPNKAQVLATSDQGLIVFQNYHPYCRSYLYYVCKPTTKQVLMLPCPEVINQANQKFAIVVMSLSPLHYKIVRFSDNQLVSAPALWTRKLYTKYRCDVFDSATWEWKSLKHIKFKYCVSGLSHDLITKSGSIYMLLSNNDVFKFDVHSEKWKIIPSPVSYNLINTDTSKPSVELVKYGGKLALACKQPYGDDCWEIWVLNRARQVIWEKVHVFKQNEGETGSLKAIYDSNTSVVADGRSLSFYRHKQEGNTMINKVQLKNTPSHIFFFRSDFEMIDLSRRDLFI